jgi:hypothetical protein
VTPALLLRVFAACGGVALIRADGRIVLRAPRMLLNCIAPHVERIGRDALIVAIRDGDAEALACLAARQARRLRSVEERLI